MNTEKNSKTLALFLSAFLILVTIVCLLYLLLLSRSYGSYVADIYQDGQLLESISLGQVQESYTIEIKGDYGYTNRIEVHPGEIGVIWADCPDRLCVRQGFLETTAIPIVCLPNRLVIRLRPENREMTDPDASDAITY